LFSAYRTGFLFPLLYAAYAEHMTTVSRIWVGHELQTYGTNHILITFASEAIHVQTLIEVAFHVYYYLKYKVKLSIIYFYEAMKSDNRLLKN
jgi:hypothetical protein